MKFVVFFLVLFLFLSYQQKSYSELEIDAAYVILQDHFSGKILYEKDSDGRKLLIPEVKTEAKWVNTYPKKSSLFRTSFNI